MSESGETGLMDGKIGIGAAFDGTPFVHVARLLALGRLLLAELLFTAAGISSRGGVTARTVC